jgi:membrane associated rhomboid family serine protease
MIIDEEPSRAEWVAVSESTDVRAIKELVLVLEARGIPSEARMVDRTWYLFVPSGVATGARAELRAYARENARPRGGERALAAIGNGWIGVLVYGIVLLVVAILAAEQAFDANWMVAGRADAQAIRAGDWWRVVTALTLHADLGHLAGNLVFGGFFGFFVAQYLGNGLGWGAILLAGALGNAINALVQPGRHLSIGASTAVFAALGILVALVWRRGYLRDTPWRVRFAPVFAGIALLAYTGTAGENTDLGAHLFGFMSGVCAGLAISGELLVRSRLVQWMVGIAAGFVLVAAWVTALASRGG